ncbi:MAG: translation initiation factor [Bacteroidia bacterium]|nr:translation initiation factor [Bacteroidia bacterium]
MAKRNDKGGLVYSTDPDAWAGFDDDEPEVSLPPARQDLRISLDSIRGNKKVTRIWNFKGNGADLTELAKSLKTRCGVGGSVKEMEILLQGDVRETVKTELTRLGYRYKQAGG